MRHAPLLLCAVLLLPAAGSAQVLRMLQPDKSVDSTTAGTVLDWIVYVRNTGAAPVGLHVVPDCGVTLAEPAPAVVQPGLRGRIALKVHTQGRSGSYERLVRIVGSDGGPAAETRFRFRVTGNGKAPVQYRDTLGSLAFQSTQEALFGPLVEAAPVPRRVVYRVKNIGAQPVRWTIVHNDPQPFQAVFQPTLLVPGAEGDVVLSYRPGGLVKLDTAAGADQPFLLPIRLPTDDARQPVKTLTLAGVYQPRPHVLPPPPVAKPLLDLKAQAAGASPVFRFVLRNTTRQPLRVQLTGALAPLRVLAADTLLAPGKTGRIVLRLNGKGLNGPIHRTVTLRGRFRQQVLHLKARYPGMPLPPVRTAVR